MNVLFVCSANRLRSPTAEQVFSTWPGIDTDSAGISSGASVLLSSEQVEWADMIFVMEKSHRKKLARQFRSHLKGKRIICLELLHRPDDDAHRLEGLLEWMELAEKRRLDALARLVSGPEVVPKRLDDVIGRDADMRRAALQHLQHRVQDAGYRAVRLVLTLVEAAQAVEMAEELVRSVYEVNDH